MIFKASNIMMNDPEVRLALAARFGGKPVECLDGHLPNVDVHTYKVDYHPYGENQIVDITFNKFPGGNLVVDQIIVNHNQQETYSYEDLKSFLENLYFDKQFQINEFLTAIRNEHFPDKTEDEFKTERFPVHISFDYYEKFEWFANIKPLPHYMIMPPAPEGKKYRVKSYLSGTELTLKTGFRKDYFKLLSVEHE